MANALTLDQFRLGLQDPNFAVAVIIGNNPEDVADRLRNMGLIVSSADDITIALNALLDAGNYTGFRDALSVPLRADRMSGDEIAVLQQQVPSMVRAAGGDMKSTGQGQGNAFNLNALFAGLATGTLAYLNATGQQQVQPGTAANAQQPAPAKDNTTMYIVIGVVVVLVIVAIIAFKKKG
jgi:F0F1-type ATP synthase membrane subunit c/vacuolar-type H+-ATPase subunit K